MPYILKAQLNSLPTNLVKSLCNKKVKPHCRFGCNMIETTSHVLNPFDRKDGTHPKQILDLVKERHSRIVRHTNWCLKQTRSVAVLKSEGDEQMEPEDRLSPLLVVHTGASGARGARYDGGNGITSGASPCTCEKTASAQRHFCRHRNLVVFQRQH
jgi:hypothetical protein